MSANTITKSIVTIDVLGKKVLGVQYFIDGKIHMTLTSDLAPKTNADIQLFTHLVTGETVVTKPEDHEPLEIAGC